MHQYRAPFRELDTFFAVRSWVDCITNISGFDLRQAHPAGDLGNLNSLSLTELIIETGIHDAIARKLNEKGKLSKNAIAGGIINNVRKTIIPSAFP